MATLSEPAGSSTAAALAGRRAIVTGGGSGIGAACARALAAAGASVTVLDISADRGTEVAGEIGGQALAIDLADIESLGAHDLQTDVLVNCAGVQHVAAVPEFPTETFERIVRLMLTAPFALSRMVLPGMYARGWGRLVHISSVHGLRASPFKSAYVSAKHGLEGLSKVIALEAGEHGVTSNTICPAYVRTPLVENQIADQARIHGMSEDDVVGRVMLTHTAIKRLIEPAEVAAAMLYLCSDSAAFVNGTSLVLDGGWTAS